jgi:hypothetical protein
MSDDETNARAERFHAFMKGGRVSAALLTDRVLDTHRDGERECVFMDALWSLDQVDPHPYRRGDRPEFFRRFILDRIRLDLFAAELQVATLEFEGRVWFDAGLAEFIRKQERAKLSACYRAWHGYLLAPTYTGTELAVRCFSTAGRLLITFEVVVRGPEDDPAVGTSVTFITEEDSRFHRMGYQSCEGTAEDVLALGNMAIYGWGGGERCRYLKSGEAFDWGLAPDDAVALGSTTR